MFYDHNKEKVFLNPAPSHPYKRFTIKVYYTILSRFTLKSVQSVFLGNNLKKIKILLIEDNEFAAEMIYDFLSDYGFDVSSVTTATEGVSYLKNNNFDLLLLDINLPDFDGFEVLKSIKKNSSIPVIITSAYSETKYKLRAFKYGAVDYMVKPLDLEELEARIWVHLSKSSEIHTKEEKSLFQIEHQSILYKNKDLDLTHIEFEVLSLLIQNKNQTLKREELVKLLSSISSQRSLDNHIKNIRKKIARYSDNINYLKTEYGIGYRFSL